MFGAAFFDLEPTAKLTAARAEQANMGAPASGEIRHRLTVFLAVLGCTAPTDLDPALGSPASEPFRFAVTFTTNQHGCPEPTCERPMCRQLLRAIDEAESSIDFAIYGIRAQDQIIDALAAAEERGVTVRGVVDAEDARCTTFGYADTAMLIRALSPGSVVCDSGADYGAIMHHKFLVLDAQRIWTGSTNLSDTELGGEYYSDVAALIDSRALAEIYRTEFEEMYAGMFHRDKRDDSEHVLGAGQFDDGTLVKSHFSPSDAATENAVLPLIDAARRTLDIAMFYFTSEEIADAVVRAHARGVRVRMVLDAGGALNQYSQHHRLCERGVAVKIESWSGKSHAKWAVADADLPSEATVVFGSMNWTGAGEHRNDENTLYVAHAGLAAQFSAEFEREWADLAATRECTLQPLEGLQPPACSASRR